MYFNEFKTKEFKPRIKLNHNRYKGTLYKPDVSLGHALAYKLIVFRGSVNTLLSPAET